MARILRQQRVYPPAVRRIELTNFKGVDLTSSVTEVKPYRSPDAVNMMPDDDGFPVKRTGYRVEKVLTGCIYGVHVFEENGIRTELIHAGSKLYKNNAENTVLYTNMAERDSTSFQIQSKLMILDGSRLLMYDGQAVTPADEDATIPLITIARSPSGMGAESYKPINLLTPWVTDSFLAKEAEAEYHLSFSGLGSGEASVEMLDANGIWQSYTDAYTLNRAVGTVTFAEAPPPSPVTGEDNVRITYEKGSCGKDKINSCTLGILYGQGGAPNRLWLSGSPAEIGVDWCSEFEDPTFFGDLNYTNVGNLNNPVMGYATTGNMLVTFKRNEENNRNVFIRSSVYGKENDAWEFPFVSILEAEDALGAAGNFDNEPVYLTKNGIYAVALTDGVSGDRYLQNRSYYLQGGLAKEKNLHNAKAITFGRYFGIAVNGKVYLLDKNQKNYEANQPHSAYQYEGYLWTSIPATTLWNRGGTLCFGTAGGELMAFMEKDTPGAYSDNLRENPLYGTQETPAQPQLLGEAIEARWTTPLMELSGYSRYKTVKDVWVVGQPYGRSGGEIYYATDKEYERLVREYTVDIFDFNDIDFNRFTFNTLNRPSIVPTRRKSKKVKLFQVRVENTRQEEAFGILAIVLEYTEGGKIKK